MEDLGNKASQAWRKEKKKKHTVGTKEEGKGNRWPYIIMRTGMAEEGMGGGESKRRKKSQRRSGNRGTGKEMGSWRTERGPTAQTRRGLIRPQRPELGFSERGKEMHAWEEERGSIKNQPASQQGGGAREGSKGWAQEEAERPKT